jgi:hypothetical protein
MDVELIYRKADGTETLLGIHEMVHMPPVDEPFKLEDREFVAKAYLGPDGKGLYRLFLEDSPSATRH